MDYGCIIAGLLFVCITNNEQDEHEKRIEHEEEI